MKGEDTVGEMPTLNTGDYKTHANGLISLSKGAFETLLNTESIDNVYALDPEPIARGQFAVVYHCTHRTTGKEYAAKFSSRVRMGADCSDDLIHEVAVSLMLRSTSRTIDLVDVFSTDSQLILVMEYAPGGDLQTLLDENIVPYENDVIKFMRQLLEGLAFIHERNLVHLDIKPQNLVLMGEYPNCAVKLCDFEISRMLIPGSEIREILGTPDYVAPEILMYEPITTRTDMWSVGVLTYVLLTGFLPFGGDSDQETFVEILKGEVDFPPELFEDVTPEAIDFIQKLLIKQPEKRMSAKESLNHSWMTKGRQRRPTPPSTLNLSSPLNSQISATPGITLMPSNIFSPVETEVKAHPVLTKSPSDGTKIADFHLPSRNNTRPPLHPTLSQKSLLGECLSVAGTPVTTPGVTLTSPFIYRQESRYGSRHNLDKLRSLSKSREVLSEKVQMSKLKKCLSKSRERLHDSRLCMSKSRETLMSLSSLSQSVEVLSALSHLAQNNLYQSCNNIFIPKPNLPKSGNPQERMYQSMAAIDQLDNLNSLRKIGYFESRMSIDSEDYNNDIITQRNTDMNCFIGDMQFDKPLETKSFGGLRGNSCIGGRGDTCDNRCSRHKQTDSNDNQKSAKVNKAEKMKKDAQKRRKEKRDKERKEHLKKERERREKEKQRNSQNLESDAIKIKLNDSPPSPSFRRGSVSHVEQRLQERHERNQERMEREREGKRNKRRVSADQDRFNSHERFKTRTNSTLQVPTQRSRSNTPTRRKSRKESSSFGSDLSQTSSMESVNTSIDKTLSDLKQVVEDLNTNRKLSVDEMNNNISSSEQEESIDPDEAYVSLEDNSLEAILTRSKSTESSSSEDSDKTVVDGCKETNSPSSDDEPGLETLSVSEKIFGFEKGIIGIVKKAPPLIRQISLSDMVEKNLKEQELPVITEETSPLSTPPTIRRSISNLSNTSDLGSLVSENSDCESEKGSPLTPSESQTERLSPDWRGRSRSYSVYSNPSPPLSSPRSRSNSFNFDIPEGSVARPWGNVCSGSVARAFEKFNIRSEESPKRMLSPALSPCEETRQHLMA